MKSKKATSKSKEKKSPKTKKTETKIDKKSPKKKETKDKAKSKKKETSYSKEIIEEPKKIDIQNIQLNDQLNSQLNTQINNQLNNQISNQLNNQINNQMNNQLSNINLNLKKEKCDGCYSPEGIFFCNQCLKLYCQKCDDQIHRVPFYNNHERKLLNEIPYLLEKCIHHNLILKYFCENCNERICEQCFIKGPHNNNNCHKVLSIFDSFKLKINYLNKIVFSKLNIKYQHLMNQYNVLERITNEVKGNKNKIMNNLQKNLNEKIENLNLIEGKKLAILNYNSTSIQKEINIIQGIINNITEYNNCEPQEMLNFIFKFPKLNEMAENIIAKKINNNIEINLNDFPKEENEKRKKLYCYNKLIELNNIKDEIIWKILTEHKYYQNEKEILNKSINEIKEWEKLSNKYALELEKYNLICYFCGCILDEKTVNSDCEKNIDYDNEDFLNDNEELYGGVIDKEELINSKRHYFIPNKNENNNLINIKKNNLSENFDNKIESINTRYATTYKSDLNEQNSHLDNSNEDE